MDVLSLIYAFFIGPLELFFEVLYSVAYQVIGDPGFSIIFLSLAMNFLVLPLYRRADAMQEEQRAQAARMKPWTDHIKRTFKGDERFMMLQTYNRQCGHKSTDALKGSVSLLLEIPFFIAAYHFLSNLQLLQGVSFGPIADLGAPDALINLGGFSINLLPLLMTAINLASAIIYMKGLPLANKIQMYGIAAIFLVLLYNSPAGLVFYWTLNNVFSLVKNIFYRMEHPWKVLAIMASVTGLAVIVAGLLQPEDFSSRRDAYVTVGVLLQVPLVWRAVKRRWGVSLPQVPEASDTSSRTFLLSGLFMAILTGALIPLAVVQASPSEFAWAAGGTTPLWYVAHTFALALGLFVLWFGVFYWLMSPRGKTVFCCFMVALAGVSIVDYLAFVPDMGNLSVDLQGAEWPTADMAPAVVNGLAVAAVAVVLVVLYLRRDKAIRVAVASLCVAAGAMCIMGAVEVGQEPLADVPSAEENPPRAALSKDGHNVVVIMMDRAIGYYVPYLIHENPELKEQLAGFTYYRNAVSFGFFTNVGSPGLYGGYDYVPEAMAERTDMKLVDKHNEALKVMPAVFMENGYQATFFDPTYAGYRWWPDLSVFDDLPGLNTYITMRDEWETREGFSSDVGERDAMRERNFFCYSLMRVAPVGARRWMYHEGDYNSAASLSTMQMANGGSKSKGVDSDFMGSYSVLQRLPELTPVQEGSQDTLLVMSNNTSHEPTVLQEPEYIPAKEVDNTAYDEEHAQRYADDGTYLDLPLETGGADTSRLMHYEVNMAMLRELGNWFDYLRENDAWDNTRIIIVSDHGRYLGQYPDLVDRYSDGNDEVEIDLSTANCLLMVKDFDAQEFTIDDTFMTNADTPALAMEGLVDNPVNPYTGNPIDMSGKDGGTVNILCCYDWNTETNDGTAFDPGYWFSVGGDVFSADSWEFLGYY